MNFLEINHALSAGDCKREGVLPKLDELQDQEFVFKSDFGLDELPERPGVILVRGARQYGKSTWLQQQIKATIKKFGSGTAYYLNGDELVSEKNLIEQIRLLIPMFSAKGKVRRIFIDEITAIENWQRGLKILLDAGELRKVLVITTGSKASDLRHGTERLPGRKGKLDRTHFFFTPVSFSEFKRVCGAKLLKKHLLPAYLISGGSPIACSALASTKKLPEYVIDIVKDWIYGEFARSGRSRGILISVMECLHRFGASPVGQSKLAREANLANNTVAAGYIDLLADLMCVASSYAYDENKDKYNNRRPCKFHISNLLAGVAWHPEHIRTPEDFIAMNGSMKGILFEWLIAQECCRRACIQGLEMPEVMGHWQGKKHEIDFVVKDKTFIEVKLGKAGPLDFIWFPKIFPKRKLTVICANRFETDTIIGMTMEDFLISD